MTLAEYRRPRGSGRVMIAFRLASPAGRVGRVVVGLLVALAGMMLLSGWVALAVVI